MGNLFYLPSGVSIEKAKELWRRLDSEGRPKVKLSYIDEPAPVIKTSERSLKDVLAKLDHSTTLVLWSITQVTFSMKEFSFLVMSHQRRYVSIRVLDPNIVFEPDLAICRTILSLMETSQNGSFGQNNLSSLGLPKLALEKIEALKKDRALGKSIRELARDHQVSKSTATKYTVGITSRATFRKKARKNPGQEVFCFKQLDKLNLDITSRFFNSLEEFLKCQRTYLTKKNYFFDLLKFVSWLAKDKGIAPKDPSQITFEFGSDYLEYLNQSDSKFKKSVVKRNFATLKSYLSYCTKQGYISSHQLHGIKTPKVPKHFVGTETLTIDEIKKILTFALMSIKSNPNADKQAIAHRNFVAIFLLANLGMRIGSLLSVRLCDVQKTDHYYFMSMQAKNDDRYTVKLDPKASEVIETYIKTYFAKKTPESYLIWSDVNDMLKPITSTAFGRSLARILVGADMPTTKKISAHSFRATYATQAYKSGLTLKEIQIKLNHKSIEQTAAYIKWADDSIAPNWMPDLGTELNELRSI